MKNTFKTLLFAVLLAFVSVPAFAQTATNRTSLAAAVANGTTTTLTLTSTSGVTTPSATQNVGLFVDGEFMRVIAIPTSGVVTVLRGQSGTIAQAHPSGTQVWTGPMGPNNTPFFNAGNWGAGPNVAAAVRGNGSCTSTNVQYLPQIDVQFGILYDCDATSGTWRGYRLRQQMSFAVPYHGVVNAAYSALMNDEVIGYTSLSATRLVTLPSASGIAGKVYIVRDETGNAGTGAVTIQLVNQVLGSTGLITTGYGSIKVSSNGTNWYLLP